MKFSKILVICGSLEKGKDGVGDYTRALVSQLKERRIVVVLLALSDKHIKEVQDEVLHSIPVKRIPLMLKESERISIAKHFIEEKKPDLVSLQFVPYAFDAKGFPHYLLKVLPCIVQGHNVQWHIMFHELWVVMAKESSFKLKIIGTLQRRLIRNLLKILNPCCVHTHTSLYQEELRLLGVKANLLPLFSNIGKIESGSKEKKVMHSIVHVGIFGSIHPGAPIKQFFNILQTSFESVKIHFIGGNGNELSSWINLLDVSDIPYEVHGRQSEKTISTLLDYCDLGISTTPYYVTQKSGSIAAMLLHDMAVVCVARPWTPWVLTKNSNMAANLTNPYVLQWQGGKIDKEMFPITESSHFEVSYVATQFINDLHL